MRDSLIEVVTLLRFGAGRRVQLYDQLQPLLDARQLVTISTYVDRARDHDRATAALEARWEGQDYQGRHDERLMTLDPVADRLLSGFYSAAETHLIGLPDHDPLVQRVRAMLADLFPAGVGAITGLPYVDQAVRMEDCTATLQGRYTALTRELGLDRLVLRLAEVTRDYRAAVNADAGQVTFANVDAMRTRGHLYLLEIVTMIGGRYFDSDDPDHAHARRALMAPVLEHNREVKEENRQRRHRAARRRQEPEPEPEPAPEGAPEHHESVSASSTRPRG